MTDKEDKAPGEQFQVFISYSHSDHSRVAELVRRLREHGVSTYEDTEELKPGTDFRDAMEEIIRKSRAFVLFIPGVHKKNDWVSAEWCAIRERAWEEADVKIFPVVLDDTEVPTCWREWDAKRLSKRVFSKDCDALAKSIRNEIQRGETNTTLNASDLATKERAADLETLAKSLRSTHGR